VDKNPQLLPPFKLSLEMNTTSCGVP